MEKKSKEVEQYLLLVREWKEKLLVQKDIVLNYGKFDSEEFGRDVNSFTAAIVNGILAIPGGEEPRKRVMDLTKSLVAKGHNLVRVFNTIKNSNGQIDDKYQVLNSIPLVVEIDERNTDTGNKHHSDLTQCVQEFELTLNQIIQIVEDSWGQYFNTNLLEKNIQAVQGALSELVKSVGTKKVAV